MIAIGLMVSLTAFAQESEWWWDQSFDWDPRQSEIPQEQSFNPDSDFGTDRTLPPENDISRTLPEKPVGCTDVGNGTVTFLGTDGSTQTAKPFCADGSNTFTADGAVKYNKSENGKASSYIRYTCEDAPPDATTTKKAVGTLTDCPAGLWCYDGACKPPEKEPGCFDSDSTILSSPESFMAAFLELNPQIKTPGFVKVPNTSFDSTQPESKDNPKFGFEPDQCKSDQILYEESCVTSTAVGAGATYFSQPHKTALMCPKGTICKNVSIAANNIINADASATGAPDKGSACVPKPDPCDPPFTDMCVDIDGCQYTPKECPSKPEVCSSMSEAELKAKYPASKVWSQATGGWHIDSCASPTQVLHDFCTSGKPDTAITLCPPNTTCANGLCNGAQAPEPGDGSSGTDCEDTDIKGASNGYGLLEVFGQIKKTGAVAPGANDKCKTTKIVSQAKCDPKKPEGYSFKDFTCPGTQSCKDGVCGAQTAFQNCECNVVAFGPDTIKGKDTSGTPFEKTDYCVGEKIVKVSCSNNTPACFKASEPLFCPDGKTCVGGVCVTKPTAPGGCKAAADGVEYIDDNGQKAFASNYCSGKNKIPKLCGPNDKPIDGKPIPCDGFCDSGKCTTCIETDKKDPKDILIFGSVMATNGSGSDLCTDSKKVLQVACKDGKYFENAPQDCPSGMICSVGICITPNEQPPAPECTTDAACDDANLCTQEKCMEGKCVKGPEGQFADTLCEFNTCDPATGKKVTTPKCTAPTICNQDTGACENPPQDPTKAVGYCADDLKCDDKDVCNGIEKCFENKCVAGTPPEEGAGGEADAICFDDDKDKFTNKKDNCPKNYNPDQADSNSNGKGDVCELQLTAGAHHACATYLKDKQGNNLAKPVLKCWGLNDKGQVGANFWKKVISPAQQVQQYTSLAPKYGTTPLPPVTKVDAGAHHSCALAENPTGGTTPYCWGINNDGNYLLGILNLNDAKLSAATKTDAVVPGGMIDIQAGGAATCARNPENEVYCWGYILDQTKPDMWMATPTATLIKDAYGSAPFKLTSLSVGDVSDWGTTKDLVCGVTEDSRVKCWGEAQLLAGGNGADNSSMHFNFPKYVLSPAKNGENPYQAAPLTGAIKVVTSGSHSCALLKDSTMVCWGRNKEGQLGIDLSKNKTGSGYIEYAFPNTVLTDPYSPSSPPLKPVADFAVGALHTCAALQDGTVHCWGYNNDGQAGGSPSYIIEKPSPIPGLTGVTQLEAGEDFTCARLKDMSVKCWGNNQFGLLGYPPFGTPTCLVQDNYGKPGCADTAGKNVTGAALVCDSYGKIDCESQWTTSSPLYKFTCPENPTASDKPQCTKIDFGVPTCLGPIDSYGVPTPKCSNDLGKVACDPNGKPSCDPLTGWSTYNPVCTKDQDPKDPPTCIAPKIPPVCGNFKVEAGEECDDGWNNGSGSCTQGCKKESYGIPSCLVQDNYGTPGCKDSDSPSSTKIVCDSYGQINCDHYNKQSSPLYLPKKCASQNDTPACIQKGQ